MSVSQTSIDSIPDEFDSYEEVAAFWDTHDTTHYPEAFEAVHVKEVDLKSRRFEVEVEADLMKALSEQAEQQGIAVRHLVNRLLRKTLSDAA